MPKAPRKALSEWELFLKEIKAHVKKCMKIHRDQLRPKRKRR